MRSQQCSELSWLCAQRPFVAGSGDHLWCWGQVGEQASALLAGLSLRPWNPLLLSLARWPFYPPISTSHFSGYWTCPWLAKLMHPSTKLVHPVGTHTHHSLPMETSTSPSKGIGEAGPPRPPPAPRIEFRSGSSGCRKSRLTRQRPCPKTSAFDASSSWKI